MSEWLDLMLEEIARKKREAQVAEDEQTARASEQTDKKAPADKSQSK